MRGIGPRARAPDRLRSPTPHGSAHLSRPVPERAAVRPAAVPGRQRPDAHLRDHGRDQPGARQLLHDRRLSRVFPCAGVRRQLRGHAAGGAGAGGDLRLCARVAVRVVPLRARPPAAGADDLRPHPGLRGVAQHPRRQRRARRAGARVARRQRATGRAHAVPRLPARDLRGVPCGGGRALRRDRAHAPGNDDPRRQLEPRDGRSRSASTSSSCIASCSPQAWPWRCWRA